MNYPLYIYMAIVIKIEISSLFKVSITYKMFILTNLLTLIENICSMYYGTLYTETHLINIFMHQKEICNIWKLENKKL